MLSFLKSNQRGGGGGGCFRGVSKGGRVCFLVFFVLKKKN